MASYLVKLWNRETKFFHSEHVVTVDSPAQAVPAAKAACVAQINPNGAPGYDQYADALHASVHNPVTGEAVDVVDESRATDSEVSVLRARLAEFEAAEVVKIESDFKSAFDPSSAFPSGELNT